MRETIEVRQHVGAPDELRLGSDQFQQAVPGRDVAAVLPEVQIDAQESGVPSTAAWLAYSYTATLARELKILQKHETVSNRIERLLHVRNMSPLTQKAYVRAVKNFSAF